MSRVMYLVLSPNKIEGVAFENVDDAKFAATGKRTRSNAFGVSSIAQEFRDAYEDHDGDFEIEKVTLP